MESFPPETSATNFILSLVLQLEGEEVEISTLSSYGSYLIYGQKKFQFRCFLMPVGWTDEKWRQICDWRTIIIIISNDAPPTYLSTS